MPVREDLNSEDEEDLAEHIEDFYEQKGESPEEIIRKTEAAYHIPQNIRDIIRENQVAEIIGEGFKKIEEPPVGRGAGPIELPREEEWNYPGMSQSITVPRNRNGTFAKGRRIVRRVVRVVTGEFQEGVAPAAIIDTVEVPELGEEYKNEEWSYPEHLGGQNIEVSVPRDEHGRWLKGKRVIRRIITPAVEVKEE